jgi:hypothetical protein
MPLKKHEVVTIGMYFRKLPLVLPITVENKSPPTERGYFAKEGDTIFYFNGETGWGFPDKEPTAFELYLRKKEGVLLHVGEQIEIFREDGKEVKLKLKEFTDGEELERILSNVGLDL